MNVPTGLVLTAATAPVPAFPAGTGEAAAAPADFLAALMAAMTVAAPTPPAEPVETPAEQPLVEPVETQQPATDTAPLIEPALVEPVETQPTAVNPAAVLPMVEEGAPAPVSKPGEPADEADEPAGATAPVLLDPALAALVAQAAPVAPTVPAEAAHPRLDKLDEQKVEKAEHRATPATPATAGPRLVEGAEKAPALPATPAVPASANAASRPDKLDGPASTRTPDLAVAGMAAPTKEHASVPHEASSSSAAVPNLPATAVQPPQAPTVPLQAAPAVANAAPAAPAAAPVANTAPLERVADQVFGQVTGLVSRGNGTHRITMTLQPEQLGEVRVVMTVRDGAVHVRMAAGHEASAALLDGSNELTRLLEHAGATETRIVVRDLPAAAVAPTTPTSHPNGSHLAGHGGEAAPDQHAGTRADHQAKDGSDHNTSRSARIEGSTSTGNLPRTPSVIGTRSAGVDLTM